MDAAPFLSKDIPNQRINPRVIITVFFLVVNRKNKIFFLKFWVLTNARNAL